MGLTFYTTRQAADMLGVSPPTVIKWIEQGRLRAHRTPGGHRRISKEALLNFEQNTKSMVRADASDGADAIQDLRVLVVDPEHDFSEMVAEYFRLQGSVKVVQALDPLNVGFQIGAFRPDVIVFDVSCPRLHVRELAQMVKQHRVGRLVLLSSSWSGELRVITDEFDRAVAVQKPVKLDQLWAIVGGV